MSILNSDSRMAVIGKAWLPKPPMGYVYPSHPNLVCLGRVATAIHGKVWVKYPEQLRKDMGIELHSRECGIIAAMEKWLKGNGPTFYPSDDILTLCEHTEALSTMHGGDIRPAIPVGLIAFPESFSKRNKGVTHILFGIHEKNDAMESNYLRAKAESGIMPRTLFCAYWDNQQDGGFVTSTVLSDDRLISDSVKSVVANAHGGKARNEMLVSLIVNILLVMQSYPEYIDRLDGDACRRIHTTAAGVPKPYAARIARPLQQFTAADPHPGSCIEPTGKTYRMHWRRGHWRRVPHSPQWEAANLERAVVLFPDGRRAHTKWIHPVLVNDDTVVPETAEVAQTVS